MIVCAPSGIVDIKKPKQGISHIADAGFETVLLDLALGCPLAELENLGKKRTEDKISDSFGALRHPEKLFEVMAPFLEQCRKSRMQMPAAYAPSLPGNTKCADLNEQLKRLAEESIKICGAVGSRYLVVRPILAGITKSDLWQHNREFYLSLAPLAREHNVQILLENQCKDYNGHMLRGVCADPYQAVDWVDQLNEGAGEIRFGFCMDVGVCSLCGQNMYHFALALEERLRAVILRDCDGNHESALVPFTSADKRQARTDWLNFIRGLRQINFQGELIMDVKDTVSAFPLFLRPEVLKLTKSVADYFKWQVELEQVLGKYPARVLFGAGNMCRNYMKCYGEKYPPLFACDNDRSTWDTDFCGLKVKNPEALKELPEDCAIFICNIYYKEIREQLQGMGIKNPIEYFNDEYMPSFYFDRLEMK